MDAKALTQRIAAARRRSPDAQRLGFRVRADEVEPLLQSLRHYTGASSRHRRERSALEAEIATLNQNLDRALALLGGTKS